MGEVRLDDGKCGQMTFWTLPIDENRVIWKATEETIPTALQSWYDHHEFVGYLGNVG